MQPLALDRSHERRDGSPDQEALHHATIEFAEDSEFSLGLRTLSDNIKAKSLAEGHDTSQQLALVRFGIGVADEAAIDLQFIKRQAIEIASDE